MSVEFSRRQFITASATAAAASLLLPRSAEAAPEAKHYGMYIDASKCYGCMACVVACSAENNVPIGNFRTWIDRFPKSNGNVIFVPKQCNHCDNPSCVPVCPTGATFKDENGLVLINDELCIGCGACVQACPYGARFMNPVKGVADKCTFCDHRLAQGLLPACVEACPTAARVFGDLNDETDEATQVVRTTRTQVLKQFTGNDPQIYYHNLPKEADV